MDDLTFLPDAGGPLLKVGEVVRVCDETGKEIATAEVVEVHDEGATLTTLSYNGV